jgi:hypothetical protein
MSSYIHSALSIELYEVSQIQESTIVEHQVSILAPIQVDVLMVQVLLHPSPSLVLPSSHASGPLVILSPQYHTVTQLKGHRVEPKPACQGAIIMVVIHQLVKMIHVVNDSGRSRSSIRPVYQNTLGAPLANPFNVHHNAYDQVMVAE